jgi:hypothetical protein
MYNRFAQSSEEPVLTDICKRAFFNDDLFGRVIHPHRAQYPGDVSIYWGEWLRADWENVRNRPIVAVAPTSPYASTWFGPYKDLGSYLRCYNDRL